VDSIVHSTATLTVIASIAVAIAGFSGVVVALTGKTTDSFGRAERLNLRILLQVSAFALLFSLVPLILHRALPPDLAWRVAMLLYGVVHVVDAGFFALKTRRLRAPSIAQKLAPLAGLIIAVGQLIVGAMAPIGWVEVFYLLVLLWHLGIAGMGFINLTFASRGSRKG
jgi:hypothetical protein